MRKYLGDITPLNRLVGGIGICFVVAGVLTFIEGKDIAWGGTIAGISCFIIGTLLIVIMGTRGIRR